MQTLDSEFSSDSIWGTALWGPAFWRLLELRIMIIMIDDCLDFHIVKQNLKYIQSCSGIRFQT